MENKRKYNNLSNMKLYFDKKPRIISSIAKPKFAKPKSDYIKYLNNPISNRFIYSKFLNKMKLKNLSISSKNIKNHSNLKSKININMDFSKQKNINTKNYKYNYTNKLKNTFYENKEWFKTGREEISRNVYPCDIIVCPMGICQ